MTDSEILEAIARVVATGGEVRILASDAQNPQCGVDVLVTAVLSSSLLVTRGASPSDSYPGERAEDDAPPNVRHALERALDSAALRCLLPSRGRK